MNGLAGSAPERLMRLGHRYAAVYRLHFEKQNVSEEVHAVATEAI